MPILICVVSGERARCAKKLVGDLGREMTECGDRVSGYFTLISLVSDPNKTVSVAIVEEKIGLERENYFYMLRLVDSITGTGFNLDSTENLSINSLAKVLKESAERFISEYKKTA